MTLEEAKLVRVGDELWCALLDADGYKACRAVCTHLLLNDNILVGAPAWSLGVFGLNVSTRVRIRYAFRTEDEARRACTLRALGGNPP